MRSRVLRWCVLAYPRDRRTSDGDYVRDLALELVEAHGFAREAWSLLTGGLRERLRTLRTGHVLRSRRMAVVAAAAATVAVLAGLAATLASGDTEIEVRSCSEPVASATAAHTAGCGRIDDLAGIREQQGWDCSTQRRTDEGRRYVDLECRRQT